MQQSIRYYLNIISFNLIALGLFLFPVLFLPYFSDAFTLPKQAVLLIVTFAGLLLWGVQVLIDRKVTIRTTSLLLPLGIFFAVVLISALFPLFQSGGALRTPLLSAFPILTLIFFYFLALHTIEKGKQLNIVLWALLGGTALSGFYSILNFFKIYILPFPPVQAPAFNTFGNLLQALFFFLPLIPLVLIAALKNLNQRNLVLVGYLVTLVILVASSLVIVYQLIMFQTGGQKIALLPQTVGLQTATGAIGQNFQTLLFGTGPGTYLTDFTRFRGADFNRSDFWNLRFFNSSSLLLEILATMGLLGLFSFLFIAYKVVRGLAAAKKGEAVVFGLFLGTIILFVLALIFPLTYTTIALLFILLALYSVAAKDWEETTLTIVALPKGVSTNILPAITFGLMLLLGTLSLYFTATFLIADFRFQQSLVAASLGRGTETYNLQREAINLFGHRDGYFRTFSQTNLALANSIAATKGSELTDQDRQTITTLVQQAIFNANQAVNIYPANPFNWENLSSIYRALIGFGQGADSFAVTSAQQAIRLDPANPQLYLFLGGIYYQLKLYDQALSQFQIAANLKPDLANAYYNIGHALEEKGDLKTALAQYRIVQGLVTDSEADKAKIDGEIEVLTTRIGEIEAEATAATTPKGEQPPLSISKPSATLPEQKPPVKIPEPAAAKEATESAK